MFVKMTRVLPEGKETPVNVNMDQIVWAQPDSDSNTITLFMVSGPEVVVKSDATSVASFKTS
ncbi:MAG TPA: hypothetical protein VNO32_52295 [Candidatus Acidoferrum sp.]|nr:hypothetical protein [Candidatus Acidoferrum sp.]